MRGWRRLLEGVQQQNFMALSPLQRAVLALTRLAEWVGAAKGLDVTPAVPRDAMTIWGAGAIHPLQLLENQYQSIVRAAGRAAGGNDDARNKAEFSALEKYFFFLPSVPPTWFGPMPLDPTKWTIAEQLKQIKRDLTRIAAGIEANVAAHVGNAGPVPAQVKDVADWLTRTFQAFFSPEPAPTAEQQALPFCQNISLRLARVRQALLDPQPTWQTFRDAVQELRQVHDAQETALGSLASVQLSYPIEGFYLFRLLVRYRITSSKPLTAEIAAGVSGDLTSLLANQPWLGPFMTQQLVALRMDLQAIDANNICFFLKGGRAIQYAQNTPHLGQNDWDTQILINPHLEPEKWYELLRRVANAVLVRLELCKAGFSTLLQCNAHNFLVALDTAQLPGAPAPMDPAHPDLNPDPPWNDDSLPPEDRIGAKAELIDVGMPRRDTVQAVEQWERFRGNIQYAPNGMPFPGAIYYAEEYLLMLRDAIDRGVENDPKTVRRQDRLFNLLNSGLAGIANALEDIDRQIDLATFELSMAAIDAVGSQAQRRLLMVVLEQFIYSYGMDRPGEEGLAKSFDSFFAEHVEVLPVQNNAVGVMLVVHLAADISDLMQTHFDLRAAFRVTQDGPLQAVMRQVAGLSRQTEQLPVQVVVTGGYAAFLYGDYLKYSGNFRLEQVPCIGMGVFGDGQLVSDPKAVMDMIQASIQTMAPIYSPNMVLQRTGDASLRLLWTADVRMGVLTYAPTLLEISLPQDHWHWTDPSFVWGFPVLGLGELVADYRARSAHVQEFGARKRLLSAMGEVSELAVQTIAPPTFR